MGTKKLSEIRQEILQAIAAKDRDLDAWLDQEFGKLSRKRQVDPKLYEELNWIRKSLAQAVKEKKAGSRKPRTKIPKAS